MNIEWHFKNDEYWINGCNKCCMKCDKNSKECTSHCLNLFRETCSSCKYDD